MIQVDPFTSFAIAGGSALVGAAMLMLEQAPDDRIRRVVRTWAAGLLIIGLSMAGVFLTGPDLAPWAEFAMLAGTVAAIPVFTWSMGVFTNLQWAGGRNMMAAVALATAVQAAASLHGAMAAGIAHALLNLLANAALTVSVWPFVVRPRSLAERAVGYCALSYTGSWFLRFALTLAYDGPPQPHHLYVPEILMTPFGLLYGTLPAILAALLLNLVNDHLHQQLRAVASTDELTGALVRREVRERARTALAGRRAMGGTLALLMLDIDRFKLINDQYGHPVGDAVLRHTAEVLRSQLRPDSLLGRYGGEEFVVLAPVDNVAGARHIAERLRLAVAQTPCPVAQGEPLTATISIGVALVGESEELDGAVARADEALYRAKNSGRDRVEVSLMAA